MVILTRDLGNSGDGTKGIWALGMVHEDVYGKVLKEHGCELTVSCLPCTWFPFSVTCLSLLHKRASVANPGVSFPPTIPRVFYLVS